MSRDVTTVANSITIMRQMSLHSTQISFIQRSLSRYSDNIMVHRVKSTRSILDGQAVKTEAVSMLNIVENFAVVAAEAQKSAKEMLSKVNADNINGFENISQLYEIKTTWLALN